MDAKELSTLDKLKIAELDILDEINRVCKENNIKYYLGGVPLLAL